MANLIDRIASVFRREAAPGTAGADADRTTMEEMPHPTLPGELARQMGAETERIRMVQVCREMYKTDPRARRIVSTLARDAVRGGFTLKVKNNARAQEAGDGLAARLGLSSALVKWIRQGVRDGDLFLELGVNEAREIAKVTRKPTLQMHRASNAADGFDEPRMAFWWADQMWAGIGALGTAAPLDAVWFAEWQIVHARWDHDDESRYGTPLFGSATGQFKRMSAGEVDIAVRRKTRAGMKYIHQFPAGTSGENIEKYKQINKAAIDDPFAAVADFFGTADIHAVQGDARLQEIADVLHHIRTWWTASPVPMSLIGYGQDLNRDVLEKQKEQYDEELDPITQWVEDEILKPLLERQWLLAGILPEGLS